MIYRGPGFLAVVWLAPSPPPFPVRQVVSLSQSSCVSPVELTDGRGGGQIIRRRESLVLLNSLNILCCNCSPALKDSHWSIQRLKGAPESRKISFALNAIWVRRPIFFFLKHLEISLRLHVCSQLLTAHSALVPYTVSIVRKKLPFAKFPIMSPELGPH
jgi:hypothetical protein